jgi:HEAT repeat protein
LPSLAKFLAALVDRREKTMSRILLLVISVIALMGSMFLAYRLGALNGDGATTALRTSIDERLAPLQGFEERLRRLEDQLGQMKADRSRKGDISAEESQGQEDRLGRTALESKISTMEQRLAGLEDDPVRRGYAFLASESDELRREGVNILKRVARFDPEARAAIRKLLRDPSARVREQTAQVLRDLRDKESAPEMMGLLADSDASIRRRAVQALTAIDAGEAIPGLADRLTSDQDDRVRVSAADGLGKLKASQAAEPLLKALKDQSEAVRREAISSLGEVGAKEAAPYLRAMYDQDPGANRMQLVLALKALGDEAPLEKEVQRLSQMVEKNADAGARRQAIRELAVLSRDSSQQVFSQALLDPSPMVRREAERALGR